MEPLEHTGSGSKSFGPLGTFWKCGFKSDRRKIPLQLFLHVNDLTDFQSKVIPIFMKVDPTPEDLSRAMAAITAHITALSQAGFQPNRKAGDAVVQPDHYARFPIEPTFFNRENYIGWNLGNALKYICRFPYKNGIEDLRKALRYIAMEMRFLQGEDGWSK